MSYWHEILEIKNKNCTIDEITKAYRKKAMQFHPDVNKSPDAATKFKEINNAFRALTDPSYRPYTPPRTRNRPKPKPKPNKPVRPPSRSDIWDNPVDTFRDTMAGKYYDSYHNERSETFIDSVSYDYSEEYAPRPIRTWIPPKEKEVDLWEKRKDPVELYWKEYERLKRTMAYEDSSEFWEKLDEYMRSVLKK